MKKWSVWLLMALLLCSRTALAAKARDIQTEADSQYHAAHLARHIGMQDLSCTGNYVKLRSKANGTTVVGHLEQADEFVLMEMKNGWAKIQVIYSAPTSPDSQAGMTGWLNADYVDCFCSAGEYNGSNEPIHSDADCKNYDEVIRWFCQTIDEDWNGFAIGDAGFDPMCFVHSLETDGYIHKDLNGDGIKELIILPIGAISSSALGGENGQIIAIYTMVGGKPQRILDGWVRSRSYLCKDGSIYSEGSDGASYWTVCIEDLKDNRFVVREGVQTSIRWVGDECEDVWLRMTEEKSMYDGEEISQAQADADISRYADMLLEDTSEFVSFAEYRRRTAL